MKKWRSICVRSCVLPVLLAASVMAMAAPAHQYAVGNLVIGHPWSRPTVSGMPTGVAYLSITNNGRSRDTLVAASSPAAARVEFHRTSFEADMAQMRPVSAVVVEPNTTVTAEPGGLHLMLFDLKSPLVAGTMVPLVLRFEKAGEITVQLQVEPMGSAPH